MKTSSQFASIAAAAAAGALFMYYVDAKSRRRTRGMAGDRIASAAGGASATSASIPRGVAEIVVEHPTAPARSAWNEQGV